MGLNIKNSEVERLAAEAAKKFGETKTEAIRVALKERIERNPERPTPEEKLRRLNHFLETEVWPYIKPEYRGKGVSKGEAEEICGIGPDGY